MTPCCPLNPLINKIKTDWGSELEFDLADDWWEEALLRFNSTSS
jgi:hypothetical protein